MLFFFQITQKITNFILKSIITTNILMFFRKMRLFKTLPKTRPSYGYFTLKHNTVNNYTLSNSCENAEIPNFQN